MSLPRGEEDATKGAFLVDVDGTLALHQDRRNPYDWKAASEDSPNEPIVEIVKALSKFGYAIVYISGRPEVSREITSDWIDEHVGVEGQLFLRKDGDQRKDAEIKREIFLSEIAPRFRVVAVLDDRSQVVQMWRETLDLVVLQVAEGNF